MTTTAAQLTHAAAALRLARRHARGGETWTAYAPVGDGITGAVSYAAAGTWAGYAVRGSDTRPDASSPGPLAAGERWEIVGAAAGVLTTGMVIVSAIEATRAYRVGSPIDVAGYVRWQAEPCAPPAVTP